MSYSREWRHKAIAETKQFWNAKRTAVAVVSAPLLAVLWTIFKPWVGWGTLMQVAAISILGFFALWAVVFFVCILQAPSQLDAEKNAIHTRETNTLRSSIEQGESALEKITKREASLEEALVRKPPHDEHLERSVHKAMAKLDERDQDFVRWLLDNGRVNRGRVQMAGFHGVQDNLNQKAGMDLITHEPSRAANGTEIDRYHQITPTLLAALKNVLHPPRPVTPPPA